MLFNSGEDKNCAQKDGPGAFFLLAGPAGGAVSKDLEFRIQPLTGRRIGQV